MRPRTASGGLTLLETLVATLLGVSMVMIVGLLSMSLIQQRTTAASSSAATSLAVMQMERLMALPDPATNAQLAAGTHPTFSVDAAGQPAIGGPYVIRWTVADGVPHAASKRVTVTVTHTRDPAVRSELVTYYKVS